MINVKVDDFWVIRETIKVAPTFVYSVLEQIIKGNIYSDNANYHIQTKSGNGDSSDLL